MAIIIPQSNVQTAAGGFMAKIFDNLPKPFRRDPKAVSIMQLVPAGAPAYPLISIQNSMLYLHSKPLLTPAYTPEVSFSLGDYSVASLAAALTAGGYGYTVSSLGPQDGTTAVLLLGFIDQALSGVDTLQIQVATARTWKVLYPIAQALYGAAQSASDAENTLMMPFSRGFWLDFWGDWLNISRLPGMSDSDYITYLIRTLRLPKANNKAIEDILTAKFGIPASVNDSGVKQFTVTMDAAGIALSSAEITILVNQVKAAGVNWLLTYYSVNSENFKAYFYARNNSTEFKNSDKMSMSLTTRLAETKFGYKLSGFMFNQSRFNNDPIGHGRRMAETKCELFYNSKTDPSYTVL